MTTIAYMEHVTKFEGVSDAMNALQNYIGVCLVATTIGAYTCSVAGEIAAVSATPGELHIYFKFGPVLAILQGDIRDATFRLEGTYSVERRRKS